MLESAALYVPLLQTLAWIFLIAVLLFVFRKELFNIITSIHLRIQGGSALKIGGVELGELISLDDISPSSNSTSSNGPQEEWATERTSIYQHNKGIFLAHILSPSNSPKHKYDIFVYLVRHKTEDFSDVDKAEFFFGHMWGNKVFQEPKENTKNNAMIGVRTSAYGPFLCTCKIYFKDGTTIKTNRYIDFEMERLFS